MSMRGLPVLACERATCGPDASDSTRWLPGETFHCVSRDTKFIWRHQSGCPEGPEHKNGRRKIRRPLNRSWGGRCLEFGALQGTRRVDGRLAEHTRPLVQHDRLAGSNTPERISQRHYKLVAPGAAVISNTLYP